MLNIHWPYNSVSTDVLHCDVVLYLFIVSPIVIIRQFFYCMSHRAKCIHYLAARNGS